MQHKYHIDTISRTGRRSAEFTRTRVVPAQQKVQICNKLLAAQSSAGLQLARRTKNAAACPDTSPGVRAPRTYKPLGKCFRNIEGINARRISCTARKRAPPCNMCWHAWPCVCVLDTRTYYRNCMGNPVVHSIPRTGQIPGTYVMSFSGPGRWAKTSFIC